MNMKKISTFPAFDLSRNGVGLFLIAVNPSQIFHNTRVSRAQEDAEHGFQRALESSRVKKISEYVTQGKVVPGAIILSAQDDHRISFDSIKSEVSFPNEKGFFLVIDGQHRLYGSHKAVQENNCDVKIPMCILTNITPVDEVQYFIDINGNQKGVSKTLRIELTKFLVEEESIDGIRLRLFDDLNFDPVSPLFGHLSSTKSRTGLLSHVPFKVALDKILSVDPLKKLPYEKKKKLIINFLSGIKENLDEVDESKRLYQAAFFQAIFRVFVKACDIALMYKRNYSSESFSAIFFILQNLNFDIHSGSNEEAISNLTKDILQHLEISLINTEVSEGLL